MKMHYFFKNLLIYSLKKIILSKIKIMSRPKEGCTRILNLFTPMAGFFV